MKKLSLLLCALLVLGLGCTRSSDSDDDDSTDTTSSSVVQSSGSATLEVESVVKYTSNSIPGVVIVFKNTGSGTAYEVACSVSAIDNNLALETVTADVSERLPSLTLSSDEDAVVDVSFSQFSSHSEYDNLEINFDWQEAYSGTVTYRVLLD